MENITSTDISDGKFIVSAEQAIINIYMAERKGMENCEDPMEDEVYNFCVDNDIEIDWDFNDMNTWNDIYFEGKIVIQIDQGITIEEFLTLLETLYINFNSEDFSFIKSDCKFTAIDEDLFKRFYNKYKDILST